MERRFIEEDSSKTLKDSSQSLEKLVGQNAEKLYENVEVH